MDINRILFGGSADDDNRKRVLQEYWKLYAQAYNVKPIPVRTATGIEYRYPQGAIQRFQAMLPMLQQQLAASRGGAAGGATNKGLLGELLESSAAGLGKWGLDKLSDGKGWGGIFDKLLEGGKKGIDAIGGLWGNQPGDVTYQDPGLNWGGDDPGTQLSPGLPSGGDNFDISQITPPEDMMPFEAADIFSSPDPFFPDMADYSTFADAPLDVADYQDWAWF